MGFLFFILFAAVILAAYITVRRRLAPPRLTAMVSMLGSAISMTLYLLTERQETTATYNVILGIIAGVVFSGLALCLAWFFQSLEARPGFAARLDYPQQDNSPDDPQ